MNQEQKLEEIFHKIKDQRSEVANIHGDFSAFPEGIEAHFAFYQKIMLADNLPLSRAEREFLAVKTSEHNTCQYCIEHHEAAKEHFELKISAQRKEFLTDLAKILSREPWKASLLQKRAELVGMNEAEFSHGVMIVGYFNMANRLVFGLDIQLEKDFKKSCH